ncbi:ParB/RepB/Spo0J family partition protein [Pseudoflavonifractor sp. 524-17]|uniref:ParB/RepB/Spo0J family partition protein n=1 Tax=Pseudoflavonifractor sp. 524-17 TaxID=2304577 RepID=UPI0013797584|nr:ParB/RepB/Spo0J family partition protein [Pseudoflavonifractor sp. 524-17]NCE64473.1 ParB/RepB/Spo0J family partition protein [Pseudoflavonifractor sp. 524-17]
MKSSAGKIQLTGFDDLFQTGGDGEEVVERVQEVPLTELFPFKDHPFQVRDDEAMEKTAQSIAEYGVLVPGIVRPRRSGGYEIVAGHRRKRGSELAGKTTMPVLIRTLDDDEATIIMVDSNLQREKILPSEKAWAYRMKLEALKHQGQRRDLTSAPAVQKMTTRDQIAQDAGEKSGMAVARYISLTKLIAPLLVLVDEEKLSVSTAADYIADLPRSVQSDLAAVMKKQNMLPGRTQLAKIKQYNREGTLNTAVIDAILTEQRPAPVQVVLKRERLKQYFPQSYTAQQMEEVIVSLLETWHTQHL